MKYVRRIKVGDRDATLTWVGKADAGPARVYALAFVSADEMLLVSGGLGDPDRWLPGGRVERGEMPEEALARELQEEADAALEAMESLGSQRLDLPGRSQEYHRFYWCRVTLAPQVGPRAESTLRHVVPPTKFLDTLHWGRSDPKATMLLERALEIELRYGV